ncbi:site-2 protease family protein [Allonocardiopsis opalescens]|uniref:Zn-dependent protease n=1 Tax=Allonocardiopsis opalescens TaxID=1144618 RepID=A0A2T0QDE7_9ACTN|nr:site-2 protease family protein [Allonocardiopsis opalescens]PRY01957.1 Zn-dependent protease [Allonocardiopsis opalescens]
MTAVRSADSRLGVRELAPSPAFLAVAGLAALGGWLAWSDHAYNYYGVFVFTLAGWLASVCVREWVRGVLAYRAGTPADALGGPLTLNPFRYAHGFQTWVLPVAFAVLGGIGIASGPANVPAGSPEGRGRRAFVALSGPLTSVLLGLVLALAAGRLAGDSVNIFWTALALLAYLQLSSAVIGLLPVPGLDGFGVVEPFLPRRLREFGAAAGPFGVIAVFAVLWFPPVSNAFFGLMLAGGQAVGLNAIYVDNGLDLFRFWNLATS